MTIATETSDRQVLDLLRRNGPMGIAELVHSLDVTATAVRQRLSRLMAEGLVSRQIERATRGRPSHRYLLTEKARRLAGDNFADLAAVLWNEIRAVEDPKVRRGLLGRIAAGLAQQYAGQVGGATATDRMAALSRLFADRGIPLRAEGTAELPVLTVVDCPYPTLAEQDRGVCAMEKMLFEELLDRDLRLSQCRLDGHHCCEFAAS
jgi:DeoR family suf operon transcriptional repressor